MGTIKLVDGCRPDPGCPCIAICLVTLETTARSVALGVDRAHWTCTAARKRDTGRDQGSLEASSPYWRHRKGNVIAGAPGRMSTNTKKRKRSARYGCFMAGSPAITVSCVGARLNGSQVCVRPSRSVATTL